MSTAGHTPNFIAEADVYPFRCVKIGSANFKAVPSTSDPEILLGVTDGSIRNFNSTFHATVGQPISLQNGEFIQLTAGGSIAVGDTLIATTDGKVVADTASTEYIAQAAEGAEDGEIFWAKKIGAWTVGGGGGGGTMTVDVQEFDDPDLSLAWAKPAGAKWVTVTMCGGGAGGQDDGPYGGGAGFYAEKQFDASDLPSSVPVQVGLAIPYSAPISETYFSFFGISPSYLTAACGGGKMQPLSVPDGINNSSSGIMNGLASALVLGGGATMWGFGGGEECNGTINGNQGIGPGGGGMGGYDAYQSADGGEGGKGGTSAFGQIMSGLFTRVCANGGGGSAGTDGGTGVGGNGGNGAIDPVTGFGGGGGGGGQGGPLEVGGNGGNGIRGGGGGGPGTNGSGYGEGLGLPGAGGNGYVRVTTICFN